MDNMRFYEASRKVPKEAQKQFNNGSFSGTDINPMWRIKKKVTKSVYRIHLDPKWFEGEKEEAQEKSKIISQELTR